MNTQFHLRNCRGQRTQPTREGMPRGTWTMEQRSFPTASPCSLTMSSRDLAPLPRCRCSSASPNHGDWCSSASDDEPGERLWQPPAAAQAPPARRGSSPSPSPTTRRQP
uniref:Uncharacterized protein n=1 Tax=Arundo donax TaxID=35708 RepID=A0A0A9HJ43_ARUDO